MGNYNIIMASKLSGVPELSIRAWEGRYSAINPSRSQSNRRLYSDSDIEKLTALKKLTQSGHRIGNLANLSLKELNDLLFKVESKIKSENINDMPNSTAEYQVLIEDCLNAVRKFDDIKILSLLNEASVKYSRLDLIEGVLLPLIEKIGNYWHEGLLRVSHEHFTSALIVKFLNNLTDGFQIDNSAPKIIITTPEGQYHEVGALIGAALANSDGWKSFYLGASLPAEDIAATVRELNARCVFLSLVYPNDNPALNPQLKKLRDLLGNDIFIISGGSAATAYHKTLYEIDSTIINAPRHFIEVLQSIRKRINPNNGINNGR